MARTILLNGNNLTLEEIFDITDDKDVMIELDSQALEQVRNSELFLREEAAKKIIYGINTGFGPMASHLVGPDLLADLQTNLIRSHAVGMGRPIYASFVLASMITRLNALLKGYSGVSVELLKRLQSFINERVIPVVPEHGAVGTSGDLIQLSHVALALIGEGEVFYGGLRKPTKEILAKLKLEPYKLKPKEGLALINGTSTMSGIAALLSHSANQILSIAVRNAALALEIVRGFADSISPRLHQLRPHPGQKAIAEVLREILSSSTLVRRRPDFQNSINVGAEGVNLINDTVQEIYSLRCVPQILGPVFDTLQNFRKHLEIEVNSVTDNPIVDYEKKLLLHGGNFHGDYIATLLDQLKITLVKLTILSERRINFFLNHNLNHFLPPFLNLAAPGLTLGLQGLQFVATSTTAQSQTYAFPHSVHSISTNADNQDVVSMGTDAALIVNKVVENAFIVLAIELVTLSQAVDFLKIQTKMSHDSRMLYESVRAILPKLDQDRVITNELEQIVQFLKLNKTLDICWNDTKRPNYL